MFNKKLILLCLLLIFYLNGKAFAISIINFDSIDLSNIKYKNRVALSTDINNFEFETNNSTDSNNNNDIDYLERNTFFSNANNVSIYVGNKSSRYNLHNILLWIGLDGNFDYFYIDNLKLNKNMSTPSNNNFIYWPQNELKNYIDSLFLIDLESSIKKRKSKYLPISTSSPLQLLLHNFNMDFDTRIYITALGSIKSGFNSQTSDNSDILIMPTINTNPTIPVPETNTLLCIMIGLLYLLYSGKQHSGLFFRF